MGFGENNSFLLRELGEGLDMLVGLVGLTMGERHIQSH